MGQGRGTHNWQMATMVVGLGYVTCVAFCQAHVRLRLKQPSSPSPMRRCHTHLITQAWDPPSIPCLSLCRCSASLV